jgi:tRNA (guanine-N7-)-methyltransferase
MVTVPRALNGIRLSWPTQWESYFGRSAPLILEIGFGYAHFLVHLARQRPEANIIGLEIANQCLVAGEEAITKHRLTNVQLVHARAETALHHLFQPETLHQVHVNFPDPWFKKRHSGRRLMQHDNLDAIVSRLQPGGDFYLATDILAYAEMSAALLAETPGLENQLPTPWASSLAGRVTTKYERKAHREGRDCYYFAYRRNMLVLPPIPVIEELPMTHLVFSTPLDMDALFTSFTTQEHNPLPETHIALMRAYRGDRVLLFEVFIKEPTLDQHVAMTLSPRPQANEYTLKVAAFGYPRATIGLHTAVRLLAEQLIALHPAAHLVQSKLSDEALNPE